MSDDESNPAENTRSRKLITRAERRSDIRDRNRSASFEEEEEVTSKKPPKAGFAPKTELPRTPPPTQPPDDNSQKPLITPCSVVIERNVELIQAQLTNSDERLDNTEEKSSEQSSEQSGEHSSVNSTLQKTQSDHSIHSNNSNHSSHTIQLYIVILNYLHNHESLPYVDYVPQNQNTVTEKRWQKINSRFRTLR